MAKHYYTVAVKWERDDPWSAQFGDYEREVCEQEAEDSYSDAYKTRIIKSAPTQAAIDAAIAKLNVR